MVCAFIDSMNGLIAARFVQGLGAAAGPVLARAIVNDRYDGIEATQLMATIAGSMAILPAVAPIGGSALLLVSDWRSLFLVLAAFGIFTLLGSRRIPESCPSIGEGKLQLNRVFLQFPECLKNPRFRGFALCGAATFSAMFCYISSASFLMMELMQVSTANFGCTFACVVSGYIVGAMTVSRKIAEWGQLRLLNYGQYCGRAGAAGLLLLAFTGFSSLPLLLASVTLIFLASGLSLSLSQMGAIREFQQRAGAASAVFGFMQLAGGAALSFLVGQAYDGSLLPAAIGISAAILLSGAGHRLIKAELLQT
jgi:DHA1 family bicyclomycin/chloramphenicol resistance-like MFS transporter